MNLNGTIMSKDKIIAVVWNGMIVDYNEKLLPLYLLKTKDVDGWLRIRAIDAHRTNSRLLKKALRITSADDIAVVLRVYAATITDTYWFKEEGSNLNCKDIRFKENQFDKLALYGDPDSFNNEYSPTPELTNIGSYEKCWRIIDGKWWMYKSGTKNELFSELFIYRLGKQLGLDMAYYELDGKYIRTADFTDGASVNFESIHGLVLDDEDYGVSFSALQEVSEKIAEQYIKMLYLDSLCFNMDRHTQNYGVLRDSETGAILSLAPLYDHNIALISRGYPNLERPNDRLIRYFTEFLNDTPDAMKIFGGIDIPEINKLMIRQCYEGIPISVDVDFICRFIMNGNRQIKEQLEEGMEKMPKDDLVP